MTRYVYILISSEDDSYAAMCLISALSVRGVDPSARITVLTDAHTLAKLKRDRHLLLEAVDEMLECAVEGLPKIASRILKTTMLQRLQSDFIFLDVDTVVTRPIAHRQFQPYSLQMALDRSPHLPQSGFPEFAIEYYEKLGWPWPTRRYFNSGVIIVRNDEAARRVFEEWHARWLLFAESGRHHDQPALNSAVEAVGVPVGCLPVQYNAMVRVNEAYRWRARVIHFFSEGKNLDQGTEYAKLVLAVVSGSSVTSRDVHKAVIRHWPLVEPWKMRRHLKAGSLYGAWLLYQKRLDDAPPTEERLQESHPEPNCLETEKAQHD